MLTIAGIEQRRSLGRAAAVVQELSPGYFVFVMATSIISTGTLALGPSWLSRVLLAIAVAGFVVLVLALAIQVAFFRPAMAAGLRDPEQAFGFFAITAGADVLGVALAAWLAVAAALAARVVAGRRPPKVSLR